ncbi:hypothetical protein DFJ67_1697 [Asanoa ferruginea]|uniref:Uncharacterized protein n=1 Tax=Asanoa ferruginea TaxID=53367 RepID=A0A3D9ZE99_9ACTN|nr:hypothetical protein DFJ67_1697 [Asanoa ferruginea]GIF53288.1 hypothetical protein Afe04nite_78270 [Asanoa ferruginea]
MPDGSGAEDDDAADDVPGMALPPTDPQALSAVAARTSVATMAAGLLICTFLGRYGLFDGSANGSAPRSTGRRGGGRDALWCVPEKIS